MRVASSEAQLCLTSGENAMSERAWTVVGAIMMTVVIVAGTLFYLVMLALSAYVTVAGVEDI